MQTWMSPENRDCVTCHPESCVEYDAIGNLGKQLDDLRKHHWFVCPAHQQPPGQRVPPGFLPGWRRRQRAELGLSIFADRETADERNINVTSGRVEAFLGAPFSCNW